MAILRRHRYDGPEYSCPSFDEAIASIEHARTINDTLRNDNIQLTRDLGEANERIEQLEEEVARLTLMTENHDADIHTDRRGQDGLDTDTHQAPAQDGRSDHALGQADGQLGERDDGYAGGGVVQGERFQLSHD